MILANQATGNEGQACTVSQINLYIKNMFLRDYALQRLCVKGEVSNCKYHSSGHIYFTIKDKASQLSCVMFSTYRKNLGFRLQEGQSVIVQGNISVYERDGKYQMYAVGITQEGAGQLYEEYEKLKKRLLAEGLFDDSRKRQIPKYAKKIGVVTAQTGAVIQDICNVSHRRNPYIQILLYPARVQGEGAHRTIIRGLQYFDTTDVDTVIIGRGGGSMEDLWEFNQEALAYAIAKTHKPVISAVGHETDTTIADFAADLRAPTPSAAAELAVCEFSRLEEKMEEYATALYRGMMGRCDRYRRRAEMLGALLRGGSPAGRLKQNRMYLMRLEERLQASMRRQLDGKRHILALYTEKLRGLSPLDKLSQGFSWVTDEHGRGIRDVDQTREGQLLVIHMKNGIVHAKVEGKDRVIR